MQASAAPSQGWLPGPSVWYTGKKRGCRSWLLRKTRGRRSGAGNFPNEMRSRARVHAMLKEVRDVRQVPGDARRRVFFAEGLDLTVWFDRDGAVMGFELCYDKGKNERAVRWKSGQGFVHQKVDDGENRPDNKRARQSWSPTASSPPKKYPGSLKRAAGRWTDRSQISCTASFSSILSSPPPSIGPRRGMPAALPFPVPPGMQPPRLLRDCRSSAR
jgi:hypothetical protein